MDEIGVALGSVGGMQDGQWSSSAARVRREGFTVVISCASRIVANRPWWLRLNDYTPKPICSLSAADFVHLSKIELDPRPYQAMPNQAKAKVAQDEGAKLKYDEGTVPAQSSSSDPSSLPLCKP